MKSYDRDVYRTHLEDISRIKCDDPYNVNCYIKGALDIANSFNTEESATGILNKNDVVQECYIALIEAWDNMNWDTIKDSDEPQAQVWAYLKKSIKLKARQKIHDKKDGIRIPHGKRWELKETKNVDDFLTQLFPPEFFADNAERMGLYEDDYMVRYDVLQLGLALEDMMKEHLSSNEQLVLESLFGIDSDKLSVKNTAKLLYTSENNVRKIKQRALQKLNNQEVRNYLENFYDFPSQN